MEMFDMAVATKLCFQCFSVFWLIEQDDKLCNIQLKEYTSILLGKTTITNDGLINGFSTKIRYCNEKKMRRTIYWTHRDGPVKPVIVGNMYRTPRVLNCDYKVFIVEFTSILSEIHFLKYEIIIV